MRLRWEQVEPVLAARAVTRARAEPGWRDAALVREEIAWSAFAALMAAVVIGLFLMILLHLVDGPQSLLLSLMPVALIALIAVPETRASRAAAALHPQAAETRAAVAVPRGRLAPEVVRRFFPDAARTRAESLYVETLSLLAESEAAGVSGGAGEDLLRQCNTLLAGHRRVERHRGRVRTLLDQGVAVAEVEAEYAALAARRDAETDPAARQTWEEGAELCARRRDSLTALGPMLARLEAHEETICQALKLAQATLIRQEAAALALDAPSVAGLTATVERITRETRAVEEAALEIARLA